MINVDRLTVLQSLPFHMSLLLASTLVSDTQGGLPPLTRIAMIGGGPGRRARIHPLIISRLLLGLYPGLHPGRVRCPVHGGDCQSIPDFWVRIDRG